MKKDKNKDNKHGVSQSDLYQLSSYAIRRKAKDLFLIYPETILDLSNKKDNVKSPSVVFKIKDEFSDEIIVIRVIKVPIIHHDFPNIDMSIKMENHFKESEDILINKLRSEFDALGKYINS